MAQNSAAVMSEAPATDQAWVAAELLKGIEAERALASEAKARGEAPPDPSLGVLYHEIAAADLRHVGIIERVATRYGHTPGHSAGTGIGEALGQIKDQIAKIGSSAIDQLSADLQAKGRSVQWLTAWAHALEAIGDTASARELSALGEEERAHLQALQQSYNQMIEQRTRGIVAG